MRTLGNAAYLFCGKSSSMRPSPLLLLLFVWFISAIVAAAGSDRPWGCVRRREKDFQKGCPV